MVDKLKKAILWQGSSSGDVKCVLCNFRCSIAPGKLGHCRVRQNIDGTLYSLNYNHVCSAAVDPIEKKPLYHFMPTTTAFSIAAVGCNFRCKFCQNWQISQPEKLTGSAISPQEIVDQAIENGCESIAYTYTEPTIFMELAEDCGKLAKQKGLKNIFVSNGYMTSEAIDLASPWLDAINIDIKGFTENFYQQNCVAKLQPVLDTIDYIANQTDIWLELTTLIIPGQNDDRQQLENMADFIFKTAGPETPWHLSRFYPCYEYNDIPATPAKTLEHARDIAIAAGLKYIYIGNLAGDDYQDTHCPNCGKIVVKRNGYTIKNFTKQGSLCGFCGQKLHFFPKN